MTVQGGSPHPESPPEHEHPARPTQKALHSTPSPAIPSSTRSPANVSMPPANVSTKGSPVTASSAMPSELVAQDARVLVVIQGVGCQPEPSSMPYIGQVMMIFGGGLAEEASAISAEPWKASAASRVSHTSTTRYPPSIGPPAWNSAPAGDPDSLTFLTTNSYWSRVRSGISARIAKAIVTTIFSLGPMVFAVGS